MMFSPANTSGESARLEDYLRAIAARRWLVIGFAALGLILTTVLLQGRTSYYTATATVVLGPTPVGSVNNNLVTPNLEKEREIVLSNETAGTVATLLGESVGPAALLKETAVAFRPDSDVMSIDHRAVDPEVAADRANAFAEAYVTARETAAIDYFDARIAVADQELDSLRTVTNDLASDIESLNRDRTDIVTTLVGDDRTVPLAEVDDQLAAVRAERADISSQIRQIEASRRADQASLASRSNSAALLRSAAAPTAPDGLPTRLVQLGGLLLGLLLGIVTAFLLERLDTTARDDTDVALALGTTVVGSIPSLGFRNRTGASALVMIGDASTPRLVAAQESFRRLRTSVQFLSSADSTRSLIVTSATPAEGKSVVAANLAIALAQSGKRVALVSADLRRPTQEDRFGIDTSSAGGLSEYLGGNADLRVVDIPDVPGLWVVPAGPMPANPGELLGSERFAGLMDELESEVEYIIIDTPPILSTADAVAAARAVDGVLVVVDSSRTESTELLQVRADLDRSGAKLVGAILNKRRYRRGGLFKRDRYAYNTAATSTTASASVPAVSAPREQIDV